MLMYLVFMPDVPGWYTSPSRNGFSYSIMCCRYVLMFQMGLKARRSGIIDDFDQLYHQQSDVCMLRMFESFLESAPQLVLQLYIMLSDSDYRTWTGEWPCARITRAQYHGTASV